MEELIGLFDAEGFGYYDTEMLETFVAEGRAQEIVKALKEKYHAPYDTSLIYTGNLDNRPGRCGIGSERWLLGFRLFDFPLPYALRELQEEFVKKADWYTWVECG